MTRLSFSKKRSAAVYLFIILAYNSNSTILNF